MSLFLIASLFSVITFTAISPADSIQEIEQLLTARSRQLQDITKRQEATKAKVEISGLTPAMGYWLQNERLDLPDIRELKAERQTLRHIMPDIQLKIVKLEEARHRGRQLPNDGNSDLNTALAGENRYFSSLVELDSLDNQLLAATIAYRSYINERIYWAPDATSLTAMDLDSLKEAVFYFVAPGQWLPVVRDYKNYLPQIILWPALILALLFGYWLFLRKKLMPYQTFATMFIKALPKPLIMLTMAVACYSFSQDAPFFGAIAHGFMASAQVLYLFEIFQLLLMYKGYGILFTSWEEKACQRGSRHILWVKHIISIMAFICSSLANQQSEVLRNSLGRVAFILALATLIVWLFIMRKTLWQTALGGGKKLLHCLFIVIIFLIPPALIAATVSGYYTTTTQLAGKALIQLAVILLICYGCRILVQRFHSLNRLWHILAAFAILLTALLIWNETIPALSLVNAVTLWTIKVGDATQAISLGDAILSVLIALFTITLTKNLATILTLAHFDRLPWDTGVRNAVATTIRYTIILVGAGGSLSVLGLSWSDIQWLVAAVSVGLGFGLQEIFANFISGIIILFERPVRPGDTVTIGSISGEVTKINIRATTIKDWDNREMIVPNKEFITGRILNWTETDKIQRAVISVGVAYGSNTDLVQELLLKAAAECQYVLKTPAPSVIFDEFGDSSLNFNLRVYVDIDNLTSAKHSLRLAINTAFEKEGINIPFPQCDVHLVNK